MTSAVTQTQSTSADGGEARPAIFISHAAPEDNTFTLWLGATLAALGYEVWADVLRLRGVTTASANWSMRCVTEPPKSSWSLTPSGRQAGRSERDPDHLRRGAQDRRPGVYHSPSPRTRLWEAHLLASFREQGLLVTQPYPSPDFHIQNRRGGEAWIEAVTANPPVPYDHVNSKPTEPPEDVRERFLGPAAVRFAKTLGSKLQRRYDRPAHVSGKPFAIALADFHAPASMTWSREALVGYERESFLPLPDQPMKLFRPMADIRQLFA